MTEEEYKKKESLLNDLKAELKAYKKDEVAKEIIAQENLIGRYYKRINNEDHKTEYLKVISCLTKDAPYTVHTLCFALPVTLTIQHVSRFRIYAESNLDNFNYDFDDAIFIWTDTTHIKELQDYEEISVYEYGEVLKQFLNQIVDITKKTFTLANVLGADYEEKIKQQIAEQDKQIQEESMGEE